MTRDRAHRGPGMGGDDRAGLGAGERFGGAWASGRRRDRGWRALLSRRTGRACSRCAVADGPLAEHRRGSSPAADWDEREAHDLYGLEFAGHEPLRALAGAHRRPAAWMTPGARRRRPPGRGGPIHAGVIESGHFRFHVVGERILALDARLFYKHRGLERAAEGHDVRRRAARSPSARARRARSPTRSPTRTRSRRPAGCRPDRELRVARTRAARARAPLQPPARHRRDLRRRRLRPRDDGVRRAQGSRPAGQRSARRTPLPVRQRSRSGADAVELDASDTDARSRPLRELRADTARAWRELEFAGSLQARLDGVGVLALDDALALGAVGPPRARRGAPRGLAQRRPRLAYDGLHAGLAGRRRPATSPLACGSARSSWRPPTSCSRTCSIARSPPGHDRRAARRARRPRRLGVGRVESPRGATTCVVELDGDARQRGCTCAPAPTPTGRRSHTPPPTTCSPTSR